jgi:polypeptide-transport-associated domain protein shlB-type
MMKEWNMKKELTMTLAMSLVLSGAAMAQSPIPTFDKEAAAVYPYNRTGDEKTVIDEVPEDFRPGNTGTEEAPAFYVKQIRLTGFPLPERDGRLSAILADYSGRSVKVDELRTLIGRLTAYAKSCGYPVAQAVVPSQEVKDGLLEIRMYVASYDTVTVVKNTSDVTDSVIEGYLQRLKTGETMTDRKLEKAINNLNDLPGVIARAVLRPGSAPGTTAVDVEVMDRPVWNNYVFVDNGGGYYSGRYRYGFNLEIDNPGHQGDKIGLSGSMSSHDTDSWSARYEAPVGRDGSRLGVAYSRSEYELNTNDWYSTLGDSEGLSIYGLTPLYRDRSDRLTLIYGYDHREIENRYRFKGQVVPDLKNEKNANVWHVGISGSSMRPMNFSSTTSFTGTAICLLTAVIPTSMGAIRS